MKVLLLLALVAVSAVAAAPRARRSFGHGGVYAHGGGYAASAPLVSSYTTARELPSYVVPEATHVTTHTNSVYSVHVPVTYSTTYSQPSVRTTSYYHAPVATYHAPAAAWGVAGVAHTGYANHLW